MPGVMSMYCSPEVVVTRSLLASPATQSASQRAGGTSVSGGRLVASAGAALRRVKAQEKGCAARGTGAEGKGVAGQKVANA